LSAEASKKDVPSGFGRIIRDDAGNILGVDLNDDVDEAEGMQMETEDLEDLDSRIDSNVLQKWASGFSISTAKAAAKDETVIKGKFRLF